MSEMRQRKGEPAEAEVTKKDKEIAKLKAELEASKATGESEEVQKEKMAESIYNALKESAPGKVKGLSHRAREYKEKLAADPYNMDYIFKLGVAYAEDNQWDKCTNVLMRGWKRVRELPDEGVRLEFLICLAESSFKQNKFRQALAVMNDAEEPQDEEQLAPYEMIRCKVYCENGDMQKGMKSFTKAIEGQDFDKAAAMWANCLRSLKRVGAYEASRGVMLEMASDDNAKARLDAVETLANLRDEFLEQHSPQPISGSKKYMLAGVVAVLGALSLYFLYLLEAESLSKMQTKS